MDEYTFLGPVSVLLHRYNDVYSVTKDDVSLAGKDKVITTNHNESLCQNQLSNKI